MFVVPFFFRDPLRSIIQWQIRPITLFLDNHGKHLCSVDNPVSWLSENGFYVKQTWQEGDILFAEIDKEKTALKDFYSFEELTKKQQKGTEECWRTFFLMSTNAAEEKSTEKKWNENFEEIFQRVLYSIEAQCLV